MTHAPLGREVLRRGIIFIDLAVAQVAGLAIVATGLWLPHTSWVITQAIAISVSLSIAAFFHLIEKRNTKEQEAIIGSTYILAASVVLVLLASDPRGGEDIQQILSGQILLVTWTTIGVHTPLYVIAGLTWILIPRLRKGFAFYAIFAIVITASVQLVGVYVVFASLVFPALAVSRLDNKQTFAALFCGFLSIFLGLSCSLALDQPAGPMLVLSYAIVGILFRLNIYLKLRFTK
tara:strand:- start:464 stop:1165 length:702 start_codon:yes stop_codon:yes gene_type:complete